MGCIVCILGEQLWSPKLVPNLNPAPQIKAPAQSKRPPSKRSWGCASVSCLHGAPRVAACQEPSLWLPESHGTQKCRPPWLSEPGNQGASPGCSYKTRAPDVKTRAWAVHNVPFQETLELWSMAEGECKDTAHPPWSLWRITVSP